MKQSSFENIQEYGDKLTVVKIDHDANPRLIEDRVQSLWIANSDTLQEWTGSSRKQEGRWNHKRQAQRVRGCSFGVDISCIVLFWIAENLLGNYLLPLYTNSYPISFV